MGRRRQSRKATAKREKEKEKAWEEEVQLSSTKRMGRVFLAVATLTGMSTVRNTLRPTFSAKSWS
jgi:hypothetical protein